MDDAEALIDAIDASMSQLLPDLSDAAPESRAAGTAGAINSDAAGDGASSSDGACLSHQGTKDA